ncbi:MAG: N(4)-(beta-N-acetylglucosaminyl)-L-asparaginase [Phycisphaeraceae bacterium]|nr:MAG: N(4)-(beta-N-acetylglucosaminyl)-L-asparaginase [Phycisphaeraceae bacterium]
MGTHRNGIGRRRFLAGSGLAAAGLLSVRGEARAGSRQPPVSPEEPAARRAASVGDSHRGPCVIASGNGPNATERAFKVMSAGVDPAEAVVAGVKLVEDDPKDNSVGYGGLPNEEGVVELDASVMHGPTHKAGAVAGLRNIKNPAAVALKVLQRTDHVLLVGEGALRFARAHGFKEENLLTPESHAAWLRWREAMGADDWLNPEERDWPRPGKKTLEEFLAEEAKQSRGRDAGPIPFTWGTIHCSAVNRDGDVGSCTTTSGLSWKIPGRVGDSPIVGAGMYCENEVGAAGSTGRGESLIVNCGSFSIVQYMAAGLTPTDACLATLKRIVDRTREKRLLNSKGRPNFNASVYALRKDGAYGGACIYPGGSFAVTTSDGETRVHPCAPLFEAE